MNIYYVYQGKTYEIEKCGQYVWFPQLTKNGRKNAGYMNMTKIESGDFILHNKDGYFVAISIAISDCFEAKQPLELSKAEPNIWSDKGFMVKTEYHELTPSLCIANFSDWLKDNYRKNSAFTIHGTGKQQYMCCLAHKHAEFLLKKAIQLQNSQNCIPWLKIALSFVQSNC